MTAWMLEGYEWEIEYSSSSEYQAHEAVIGIVVR
jgi:hypothetical protein